MAKPDNVKKVDGGYKFYVFPSNNNNQPLGESSKLYTSASECQKAFLDFRRFIAENSLNEEDGENVRFEVRTIIDNNGRVQTKHYFKYYIHGDEVFCRTPGYSDKRNCLKGIKSIYNALKFE